ncbi:hypothetical protein C5Y96_02370 [Blastopirellula marina]|uniref:Uncharacterized protein n=1 Tax=Blastopirellula marina TaxID=124 RepID=A0A2S8G2S0_9BACT|nr:MULTISPECIES: hypothetical protein [Pirellulaceae]PQO38745.1 hypothetical protein C5Y96_02370 [Blastopirellula marina]RCS55053.1 hypothetical protein DTL36_02375 [Bremerella cremea]
MRYQAIITLLSVMLVSSIGSVRAQDLVVLPPTPPQVDGHPPVESMEQMVYGEPGCCAHCTQQCACQKRKHVICEIKKVKKTVFDCECEGVCGLNPSSMLPDSLFGISLWGHKKVGCGEAGCGDCAAGCCPKAPQASHCRTRKVLVKKTITVEVPVYKCVVEYCCDGCGGAIDFAASDATSKEKDVPHVASLPSNQAGYGE